MTEPDAPDTRGFLQRYRAYILVPVVVTLLLGALMVVGSRQGAPFVYTLF
ncbi:MAG: hypothetical protein JWM10_5183 [Myxococcaceae bacterium]|nr:hypothetical protein [Myxococcaceae bacterium]